MPGSEFAAVQTTPPAGSSNATVNGADPVDAAMSENVATTSVAAPKSARALRNQHKPPVLGPGDPIGAGDSYVQFDLLPDTEMVERVFGLLKEEVGWNKMFHRGGEVPRLVAVQGQIEEDGSIPVYRHPADESPPLHPWTPTVQLVKEHVERVVRHPVNHVLIQLYRSGADYISEHSDKTIDVMRGSSIVNVSFGAQRTMTLKMKRDGGRSGTLGAEAGASEQQHLVGRPSQKIPLPHNSIFIMGLETNEKWLHAINHDNRPFSQKSAAEQFEGGERISLTFRHIGTFLTTCQRDGGSQEGDVGGGGEGETRIYGQGARAKSKGGAQAVVRGGPEAERLLAAFGEENQQSSFDWEEVYGGGFDVLHF